MKSIESRGEIYLARAEATPIGPVWVAVSQYGLVAVEASADQAKILTILHRLGFEQILIDEGLATAYVHQIEEYLNGQRTAFDLPIDWSVMTLFQQEALKATFAIPYGQVSTYAEIARQIGRPRAARAVGRAEATNPMPLVIPCHRVLGTDGKLHGYGMANGLETKAWLLKLESEKSAKS